MVRPKYRRVSSLARAAKQSSSALFFGAINPEKERTVSLLSNGRLSRIGAKPTKYLPASQLVRKSDSETTLSSLFRRGPSGVECETVLDFASAFVCATVRAGAIKENGGIHPSECRRSKVKFTQKAKVIPLRAIPKLLLAPSTTFQLKSLIHPMCGVRRISRPPPAWPNPLLSLPECVTGKPTLIGLPVVSSSTKESLSPPPKIPPPPTKM